MGIDYSTIKTGYAVMDEGKLLESGAIELFNLNSIKERRKYLLARLNDIAHKYNVDTIVLERLRLFHHSKIPFKAILKLASIVYMLIDNFPIVYSIDTRTWKRLVLGRASATKDDAMGYVLIEYQKDVSHDEADAICIAESAFCPDVIKYLKLED